jgi:inner membrane transporter RhtA
VAAMLVAPVAIAGGALGQIAREPALLVGSAGVALFASVIPWTLELTAMRRMTGATYAILVSLEPAVAAMMGAVLIGQGLSITDTAAIGLVVAASAGSSRTSAGSPPVPGEIEV